MRAAGFFLWLLGAFGLGVSLMLWIGLGGGLFYPLILVWLPSALIFWLGRELERERPKGDGEDGED